MTRPTLTPSNRDAPDLWGGLAYQRVVTLCSWLALGDDELLYVELEEDLAVSGLDRADAVQVRRKQAAISLNTADAHKTIEDAFAREIGIYTVYLTTSPLGREQGRGKAGDAPGIALWSLAADGDDDALETVRAILLKRGGWSSKLRSVLQGPATSLREKLIHRLKWDVGQPNLRRLQTRALNTLAERLRPRHPSPANLAALILPACLKAIDDVADKASHERVLDRPLFDRIVEEVLTLNRNVAAANAGPTGGAPASTLAYVTQALDLLAGKFARLGEQQLADARKKLGLGQYRAAAATIDLWIDEVDAEPALKGAALRLRAETCLALREPEAALSYAEAADRCDGQPDRRLAARILGLSDPSRAIAMLDEAGDEAPWLRAELMVSGGQGGAARDLLAGIDAADDQPWQARIRAMALAAAGSLIDGLAVAEAARSRSDDIDLLGVLATLHFVAAQAPGQSIALSAWPAPENPDLTRDSDKARQHLRDAAALFEQIAGRVDDEGLAGDLQVWRLACLCLLPDAEQGATEVANKLLDREAPHPGAVHWALRHDLSFDAAKAEARLKARTDREQGTGEEVVALAVLMLARRASAEALAVFRQHRERGRGLVDDWISNLEADETPGGRVASAIETGQASGDWSALETLAAEPDWPMSQRLTLLQILATNQRWNAVAAQVEFLEHLATSGAIRLAAIVLHNTDQVIRVTQLLETKRDCFVGSRLPDDLVEIYIENLVALGRIPDAYAALEAWSPEGGQSRRRMLEIRLRLHLGDVEGSAGRLDDLDIENLPVKLKLQLASQMAAGAPEKARRLMGGVDFDAAPIELAGLAYDVAERTKLDRKRRGKIFGRLLSAEARAAGLSRSVSLDELTEHLEAASSDNGPERYESGEATLHQVLQGRIGRVFARLLSPQAPRFDVLARDAGALDPKPITEKTLRLDVTGVMMAHGLGLLEAVYKRFDRVEVGYLFPPPCMTSSVTSCQVRRAGTRRLDICTNSSKAARFVGRASRVRSV
jgi:hypothetical protein